MPPTSLPRHRGGNVSLSHGSGNLHLSGQEEELTGIARNCAPCHGANCTRFQEMSEEFQRKCKHFEANMPQCHNSAAETTTLKSPNCFSPETNETKHNRKIPITTTVTFFGSLSLGPFLCQGSCHTSALVLVTRPEPQRTRKTTAALRPGPEQEPGDAAAPTPTPSRATQLR